MTEMYRFKRNRKFAVSNRLALAAALALCVTAFVGGPTGQRDETPFARAVSAITQQAGQDAEDTVKKRRGLTANFLLLRGR